MTLIIRTPKKGPLIFGSAHIYIYMLTPPTTPKNAHFAHLSITVIRQRLRKSKNPKSKNPKIHKSKTFYIYGILPFFFDFWIFGFLDFKILGFLEFWSLRFFDMCSVVFVVLCVVCLLCLASGIHL